MTGTDSFNTAHRTGYGSEADRTDALLAWLTKYPDATLASGEGRLLLARIREMDADRQTLTRLRHALREVLP
jgi:hypothetical protein